MAFDKDINLIPESKGFELKSIQPSTTVIAGFLLFFAILAAAGILQQRAIDEAYSESVRIKEEIASYNYIKENIKMIEDKKAELVKRQETIDLVEKEKIKVLDFLNTLKDYVPANVHIVYLSITNGENADISFETSNTYDVARLIAKLEEMDAIEKVETKLIPINNKVNTVDFKLLLKKNSKQVSNK